MDEQNKKLKCRFCGWQIALYTLKDDEMRDNWPALKDHVAVCHPDEFVVIQRSLVNDGKKKTRQLDGDKTTSGYFSQKRRRRKTHRIIRTRRFLEGLVPELYFREDS